MSYPTHAIREVRSTVDRLRADRRPFVLATVVRAERPTSAKAGDAAVVLDDGTVLGFVGGECAQASVQTQALAALRSGEPVLLTISPDGPAAGEEPAPSSSGAVVVHNPCLSGGTLEIFLEPTLPPPLVVVHGDAPIARAVRDLASWMGYDARAGSDALVEPSPADAVVVATHGGDEAVAIRAALDAGVAYVGLVASHRRGDAVLAALALTDAERARVRSPAGLDIGSHTPEEVALSILAEIVSLQPSVTGPGVVAGAGAPAPTTAIDPVCGMTVATVETSRHLDHQGTRHWFCGSGCAQAFAADPTAFVGP